MGKNNEFAFIADEPLRLSLETDYREFHKCIAAEAWKAAIVLSGSIVEALLVDHLQRSKNKPANLLKMSLGELVCVCKNEAVLSERTIDLSNAVRGFRNLIHPGKSLRLQETADEESGKIASALLSLIRRDVEKKQAQEYGLNADQMLMKTLQDPSSSSISKHLLREMRPEEIARLMIDIIPRKHVEYGDRLMLEGDGEYIGMQGRLERLYIEAYQIADSSVQKRVVKKYIAVLKGEAGDLVEVYEERLFRGYFLEHMTEGERRIAKDHFFSRTNGALMGTSLVASCEGMAKYLDDAKEVTQFYDPLIRIVVNGEDVEEQIGALARITEEHNRYMPERLKKMFADRVDSWTKSLRERKREDALKRVASIRAATIDEDIPFKIARRNAK